MGNCQIWPVPQFKYEVSHASKRLSDRGVLNRRDGQETL